MLKSIPDMRGIRPVKFFNKTMATKPVPVGTLKSGSYVVIEGVACRVVNILTSRPGKHGHAKCRVEGIGLIDNQKKIVVMPGHDKMESPIIEKKTATVLSVIGDAANVMDLESYETFDLKIPQELAGQVIEGCQIIYWIILKDKIMKQIKSED